MTASLANHHPPQRGAVPIRAGSGGREAPLPHAPAAETRRAAVEAPLRLVPQPEGLLQIHTAPFRGSFAAVFSQALRTAGLGSRVLVSQFLKGGVDQGPAGILWLCGRLQWLRPATLRCLEEPARAHDAREEGATDDGDDPREAVRAVWEFSREELLRGSVDLMVLDELGLAIELEYLPADEVLATLERRPAHLDVILTGPAMPPGLMAMADQVTELRRGY